MNLSDGGLIISYVPVRSRCTGKQQVYNESRTEASSSERSQDIESANTLIKSIILSINVLHFMEA
jgi:hypothetical protein